MQVFEVLKILSVQLKKLFVFSFLRIKKTKEIPPKKTFFLNTLSTEVSELHFHQQSNGSNVGQLIADSQATKPCVF